MIKFKENEAVIKVKSIAPCAVSGDPTHYIDYTMETRVCCQACLDKLVDMIWEVEHET